MNELNIKSSTIEKGLELAKEFAGKLISPAIEEFGLLIADNVRSVRFKNQVRLLLKTKEYVEKGNIDVKELPIKILVPLLENASLEEEEELQDKWAIMLTNMVDSESNLQNTVFPYVLSQISYQEYGILHQLSLLEMKHSELMGKLSAFKHTPNVTSEALTQYKEMGGEANETIQSGFDLIVYINNDCELPNLVRLGLITELPPRILIDEFSTGSDYENREEFHVLEAEYDTTSIGHRITELGNRFIQVCEIKQELAP